MTKRNIIYTVMEKLKIESDDNDISSDLISSMIDSTRAMLVKQFYSEKGWNIPVEIKQEICLALTPVDNVNGASCFGSTSRSVESLPKGISLKGVDGGMLRVKTYDRKNIQLNIVPMERIPFVGQDQFTSGLLYCAIDIDRKIYFASGNRKLMGLEVVKVDGVYESPEDAFNMRCIEYGSTGNYNTKTDIEIVQPDNWDEEYPMELSMQDIVIETIMKSLLQTIALPADTTNDSTNDRSEKRK